MILLALVLLFLVPGRCNAAAPCESLTRDLSDCHYHISQVYRPENIANLPSATTCSFVTLSIPTRCAANSPITDLLDLSNYGIAVITFTPGQIFTEPAVPLGRLWVSLSARSNTKEPLSETFLLGQKRKGSSESPGSPSNAKKARNEAVTDDFDVLKREITIAFNETACRLEFPDKEATMYFSKTERTGRRFRWTNKMPHSFLSLLLVNTKLGNSKVLRDDHFRSVFATQNRLEYNHLKALAPLVVDIVTIDSVASSLTIPVGYGEELSLLYPSAVSTPIVRAPLDQRNDRSFHRCFRYPSRLRQDFFTRVCTNLSLPLWKLDEPSILSAPKCEAGVNYLPVINTGSDKDDFLVCLADFADGVVDEEGDEDETAEVVESLKERLEFERRLGRSQSLLAIFSKITQMHRDVQNTLGDVIAAYELSEARHQVASSDQPSLLESEIMAHRGWRNNYHGLFDMCIRYFSEVHSKDKLCTDIALRYHNFVEIFDADKDVTLASVRCSLCFYGHPPPPKCVLNPTDQTEEPELPEDDAEESETKDEEEWKDHDFFDVDGDEEQDEGIAEVETEGHSDYSSYRKRRAVKDPKSLSETGSYDSLSSLISSLHSVPDVVTSTPAESSVSDDISKPDASNGGTSLSERKKFDSKEGRCMSTFTRNYDGLRALRRVLERHAKRATHKKRKLEAENDVESIRNPKLQDPLEATEAYARLVYMIMRHGWSMRQLPVLYEYQLESGRGFGTNHYSRRSGTAMALSISHVLHESLIKRLKRDQFVPMTLLLDGSDDITRTKVVVFQIRTLIRELPVTLAWTIENKPGDKGRDYLEVLLKSLKEASSIADLPGDKPFAQVFAQKLASVCTDGASNMRNTFWNHINLFRSEFNKAGTPALGNTWCKAHLLERIIRAVGSGNEYIRLATNIAKQAHKLFSTATHGRSAHMMESGCQNFNGQKCNFKATYEIRWVHSAQRLLKNLLENYSTVLYTIRTAFANGVELKDSVRNQLRGLYHVLKDVRVFVRINAIENVLRELTHLSLELQKEDFLETEAQLLFNSTFNKLRFHSSSSSYDLNLIAKDKPGKDTYDNSYGFVCVDGVKPATTQRCSQKYLNQLFSDDTAKYDWLPVMKITGKQTGSGNKPFLRRVAKKHPHYLVRLRLPNEPELDLHYAELEAERNSGNQIATDELTKRQEVYVKSLVEMKTRSTGEEYSVDFSKYLSSSTDEHGAVLEDVVILKMYLSITWNTHDEFKKEYQNKISEVCQIKAMEAGIDTISYYSVHPEVIIDAAFCSDSIDPIKSSSCKFAEPSDDLAVKRNWAFYMTTSKHLDTSKRLEVFSASLKYLTEALNIPNAAAEYRDVLANLQSKVSSITEQMVSQDPMLVHWKNERELRSLNGSLLFQTLLRHQKYFGLTSSVVKMLRYSLVVAPTSATVERAFSHLNHFKDSKRTQMDIKMMNARLRSIHNTPGQHLMDFSKAVNHFLYGTARKARPVSFKNTKGVMWSIHTDSLKPVNERVVVTNLNSADMQYSADPSSKQTWYHRTLAKTEL